MPANWSVKSASVTKVVAFWMRHQTILERSFRALQATCLIEESVDHAVLKRSFTACD
jgi:hypothetical protein